MIGLGGPARAAVDFFPRRVAFLARGVFRTSATGTMRASGSGDICARLAGLRAGLRAGGPGPAALIACVISCSARASSPSSCAALEAW